jgi:cytochrome bd-type quinol oxidase subunit 2
MAPPPGYVAYGGPGAYSPTKPIRGLTTWLRILLIGSLVVTALTLVAFGGTRVGGSSQDVAEQFRDQLQVTILSSVVSVATAVVFILLVRQLAVRHMKATGEAR